MTNFIQQQQQLRWEVHQEGRGRLQAQFCFAQLHRRLLQPQSKAGSSTAALLAVQQKSPRNKKSPGRLCLDSMGSRHENLEMPGNDALLVFKGPNKIWGAYGGGVSPGLHQMAELLSHTVSLHHGIASPPRTESCGIETSPGSAECPQPSI